MKKEIQLSTRVSKDMYEQIIYTVKEKNYNSVADLVRTSIENTINPNPTELPLELRRTLLQATSNMNTAISAMETYLPSPKNNPAIKNLEESRADLCRFYQNF